MSCRCEAQKRMSESGRVSELARKAAILEQKIMAVYRRSDGTYGFDIYNGDNNGVVELRHYL